MDLTPEMMAVAGLAPKERIEDEGAVQKPDQVKLTRVLLTEDNTMLASDGTMIALVRRHQPEGEEPSKENQPFTCVIPGEQVRRLAGAVDKLKADEVSVRRNGFKATAETRTDQGDVSIQMDVLDADDYPKTERYFQAQGQLKAMVALDSRYLAEIAKMRARVGGHGPVLFFIGKELDNVVAAWRADLHEGRVVLASTLVDKAEWDALAPKVKR